jgi:hypothetical protein
MERRELIQILAASGAMAQGQGQPYAPLFFTAAQWTHLADLTDALLPEEPGAPGARSAEVPRYIDTILLHSDPATQAAWRRGLDQLDPKEFAQVSAAELDPVTEVERFFVTFKRLALEAFFQSPAAAQFFGYRGNVAIEAFPGCAGPNNPTSHRH